ncbi:hypothetical protein BK246_16610 [Escherichia coli]|nr:hypothetical protein BK246_16610 [Escherichia coli]
MVEDSIAQVVCCSFLEQHWKLYAMCLLGVLVTTQLKQGCEIIIYQIQGLIQLGSALGSQDLVLKKTL